MPLKVFVGILVVLVLLLVVGVVRGASSKPDSGPAPDPGWAHSLRDALSPQRKLDPSDVRVAAGSPATCLSQQHEIIVPLGQSCSLTISSSPSAVRTLAVGLHAGPAAALVLKHESAGTAKKVLLAGQSAKLDVYAGGGALAVTCKPLNASATGVPCRIALQ